MRRWSNEEVESSSIDASSDNKKNNSCSSIPNGEGEKRDGTNPNKKAKQEESDGIQNKDCRFKRQLGGRFKDKRNITMMEFNLYKK